MDEAELARQMEKAELENAEIAGNNVVALFTCDIGTNLIVYVFEQVMTISLTWKQREQEATKLQVEKKTVKQKRKNKIYSVNLFLLARKIQRLYHSSTPITQLERRNFCLCQYLNRMMIFPMWSPLAAYWPACSAWSISNTRSITG